MREVVRTRFAGAALLAVAALVVSLAPRQARANGRMPGANDVVFGALNADHLLLRATFGLLQTHDRGRGWQWICEQAIDISGVIADPPVGLTADGSLVLLPPTGGVLVSHDGGCSWSRDQAGPAARQGVDLTAHPSDAAQLFTLFSTVTSVDGGVAVFENRILRTRDDARTWELVANLPSDFSAETLELAKSDPQRIYVSGVDSVDPRLGVLLVSRDGGAHFEKHTLALPAGSGSLLVSAIHPSDPERVWLRVPARGDTIGLLPARLYLTTDGGAQFRQIASTQRGMFGFALSPDGATLAYGGPADGLYVGPADGSGSFEKRGNQSIRCLRWHGSGALYACASEPTDPFSLGVSLDQGRSFSPLYRLATTCPSACAEGTQFASACRSAWSPVQTALAAPGLMCSEPWAARADAGMAPAEPDAGERDAGFDAGGDEQLDASAEEAGTQPEPPLEMDASAEDASGEDASAEPATRRRSSSGCHVRAATSAKSGLTWLTVFALIAICLAIRRGPFVR
ncbi:MAG TPA: hypothetical protein VFZ61_09660 [Polyangiales bacterium]